MNPSAPEKSVPRVFISHSSADKQRFVLPFAAKLRERGVDAWVDVWELAPGDSLVGRLFEAIDAADAVIVVISRSSIESRWVAEELDAAAIKRIQTRARLLPLVLDDLTPSEIPAPIRHLVYEPISDLATMDTVVDRVVRSIHGTVEKPPLGVRPRFAREELTPIQGLDAIDTLTLRQAGHHVLRTGSEWIHTREFVTSLIDGFDVTEDQAIESIQVLESAHLLTVRRTFGAGIDGMSIFEVTPSGFETYLRAYVTRYGEIETMIVSRLASWPTDIGTERELSEQVDAPQVMVGHVLERLAATGLVRLAPRTFGSSGLRFHEVSPRLRRLAAQ